MNAYARKVDPARKRWRESVPPRCMRCCVPEYRSGLEVHEIEHRSQASKRWWPESGVNGLLLCRRCHDKFTDFPNPPLELAIKLIRDPDHFNLEEWLRIRDPDLRAPRRVEWADIVEHLTLDTNFGGSC